MRLQLTSDNPRGRSLAKILTSTLLLLSTFDSVVAVKRDNFKTCSQSGFCKRNRALADEAAAAGSANWKPPYEIDTKSIRTDGGQFRANIVKTVGEGEQVELPIVVSFLQQGGARVQIDEKSRQEGKIELRNDSKARKERYNEAAKWALVKDPEIDPNATFEAKDGEMHVVWSVWQNDATIRFSPFEARFNRGGETHVILNERHLLNVEHWRPKPVEGDDKCDSCWDESFGGNTDSKPRGPESIGMDITFPGFPHVYGIPEHASSMKLKETRGGDGHYTEPYRLYNADVFEYETDSPMTLYGSIPFMQAHKKGYTVGVFWLNAAETWVDVTTEKKNPNALMGGTTTQTHWMSESGVLDLFVFMGPNSQWLYKYFTELVGTTPIPQLFALGYHQCRWNYVSQDDVKEVDTMMDKFDIPYDVIWLDIEYTDGKAYFTWDPSTFSDPASMVKTLDDHKRKLVAIIDPHIKKENNYPVVKEMVEKGLAVKDKSGKDYEGWCWPGSSHWVDCFDSKAADWWKGNFKFDKFKGTADNVHIWNDMNEPSVFNGPETTMPKDNLHHGGWEHRDVHNLYGMTFHSATYNAIKERNPKKPIRPFVLTRAFFAGSQRTAAMWTGDNEAKWEHLAQAVPMLLSQGIAGMPFAGADVGGFFGNPSKELLTRWYQAGAFYPFFRAHAHIDAKRREPYLSGEPYVSIIRDAIKLRYSLLPALYTSFHRASWEGMPILRPMFLMFPDDEEALTIDDQFFFGDTGIIVKPVVEEGATTTRIWIPDDGVYYDYFDYTVQIGQGWGTIQAPLEKIPILMRGGHIFPRKDRPRRSAELMKNDPYTIVIPLSRVGDAAGVLYVDDGESFDYQNGSFLHKSFIYQANKLISKVINAEPAKAKAYLKSIAHIVIERVIVIGVPEGAVKQKKAKVTVGGKSWDADVEFFEEHLGKAAYAVVKNPKVPIGEEFEIELL